jgi:hypothetical protein
LRLGDKTEGRESRSYLKTNADGNFWHVGNGIGTKKDFGRNVLPFGGLDALGRYEATVVGIIPHLQMMLIVAIDELAGGR